MSDKCTFCKDFEQQKEIFEYDSKNANFKKSFAVALVRNILYRDSVFASFNRNEHELNFCPTCGRKIEKDELHV